MTLLRQLLLLLAAASLLLAGTAWAPPADARPDRTVAQQLRHERAAWHAERGRLVRIIRQRPDVQTALSLASVVTGVDRGFLAKIAWCESSLDPGAQNPSGSTGLLQFMPDTWDGNTIGKALGPAAIWDPYASAMAAAWHIRRYGAGPGRASRHCWGGR